MIPQSLDEMVEDTTEWMEEFLKTHIPASFFEIHEDIEIMRIFMDISQQPDFEVSEHEINMVMEALGRCRSIQEFGDLIITTKDLNLKHTIFGAN
jgi:hypothetical protein